jgi:transcription elongation factor GreA
MSTTILTRDGLEKLRAELGRLREVERPHATQALREAREAPDFQESTAFAQAVEQLQLVERRIGQLEGKLANARVVENDASADTGRAAFGSVVTLRQEPDGEPVAYRIVGEDEADIGAGKLSAAAPLAVALIGQAAGARVAVDTPRGTLEFRILEIRQGASETP